MYYCDLYKNWKNNQKREGSRKSSFENFEKNALMELPSIHYEVAEWKNVKSNIDDHIKFDHCYYSVHYKYRNKKLTASMQTGILASNQTLRLKLVGKRYF